MRLLHLFSGHWARRSQRYAPRVLDIDRRLTRRAQQGTPIWRTR